MLAPLPSKNDQITQVNASNVIPNRVIATPMMDLDQTDYSSVVQFDALLAGSIKKRRIVVYRVYARQYNTLPSFKQ